MRNRMKKGGEVVSERLSPAEMEAVTICFPPKAKLALGSLRSIRWEMRRIYEAVIHGKLPLTAGTKLFYMLEKVAKSKSEEEKLAILEKGGIAGAPFVGLMIEPPAPALPAPSSNGEDEAP